MGISHLFSTFRKNVRNVENVENRQIRRLWAQGWVTDGGEKASPTVKRVVGEWSTLCASLLPLFVILWENPYGSRTNPTGKRVMPNSETGNGNTPTVSDACLTDRSATSRVSAVSQH